MSYEILVGLDILGEAKYENYRLAIKQILLSYKGEFWYDFKVFQILKKR